MSKTFDAEALSNWKFDTIAAVDIFDVDFDMRLVEVNIGENTSRGRIGGETSSTSVSVGVGNVALGRSRGRFSGDIEMQGRSSSVSFSLCVGAKLIVLGLPNSIEIDLPFWDLSDSRISEFVTDSEFVNEVKARDEELRNIRRDLETAAKEIKRIKAAATKKRSG